MKVYIKSTRKEGTRYVVMVVSCREGKAGEGTRSGKTLDGWERATAVHIIPTWHPNNAGITGGTPPPVPLLGITLFGVWVVTGRNAYNGLFLNSCGTVTNLKIKKSF